VGNILACAFKSFKHSSIHKTSYASFFLAFYVTQIFHEINIHDTNVQLARKKIIAKYTTYYLKKFQTFVMTYLRMFCE
jgi:hypothetical protein